MVLHKNKWDKRATYNYMRKHGLTKRQNGEPEVRPKWSSKSTSLQPNRPVLDDSDSDWDLDNDDALLAHFYPELGESDTLTRDQKIRIKNLILEEITKKTQGGPTEEQENGSIEEEEPEGIYLGSEESRLRDEEQKAAFENRLDDYISQELSKPKKTRKLLKNKFSDNLLEEYGLETYKETVTADQDYNKAFRNKQGLRHLDDISAEELAGFRVGEDLLGGAQSRNSSPLRALTEEEKEADAARAAKIEQARLYGQIRARFEEKEKQKPTKVLEINNFNDQDARQMEALNRRITAVGLGADDGLDDDLDLLVGGHAIENSYDQHTDDIDAFISSMCNPDLITSTKPSPTVTKGAPASSEEAFLDDLLG